MYVKGSSLLESIIAITVISICLLVAMQLYAGLLSDSPSLLYYKAKATIDSLVIASEKHQEFDDEEFNFESYLVKKELLENSDNNAIKVVNFKSFIQKDTINTTYIFKSESAKTK